MSLSIGLPASFVNIAGSTSGTSVSAATDTDTEQGVQIEGLPFTSESSAKAGKKSKSGLGDVIDTLLDRMSELHERLQRLRQELRAALKSPQPDVVRLPRILSLQREILVTNSDIQLVSGLLITSLNPSSSSINAHA